MRSSVRDLIQLAVLRTSFFPLTCVYRGLYSLAIFVATLMFKRVDGVLSVYLRRGLAKGEVVYGLSDIDLLIIVEDEKGEGQEAKKQVKATYDRLARFIPLFGSSDRELEVYSTTEFSNLYDDYGFYRYRFNEGKYTWRLLYGYDAVNTLPQLSNIELYLPSTEELKTWWALLTGELNPECSCPRFKRKYLWYKALAEASKAYLFVCHNESLPGREAALSRVKHYLPHEQRCYISGVQSYLKHLTAKDELPPDGLLKLFFTLVSEIYKKADGRVYEGSNGKLATLRVPGYDDLTADRGLSNDLRRLVAVIREELEPYPSSIALLPQVEFDPDILSNTDIDSFYLVVVPNSYIPIEKLARLKSLFNGKIEPHIVEPFVVTDGNIAFSLQVDTIRNSIKIKSPGKCPIFYALLSVCNLKHRETDRGEGAACVSCYLPADIFERIIRKREVRINAITAGKNLYKMKTLDFLVFFWAAARTKLLACTLECNEVYIPVTSRQIVEVLRQRFPGDSSWLDSMYEEYKKELQGKENEAYRYFSRAVGFLNHI